MPKRFGKRTNLIIGFVLLGLAASNSDAADFIPPCPTDIYIDTIVGSELGYGDEIQPLFTARRAFAIVLDYIYGAVSDEQFLAYYQSGAFDNFSFASFFQVSEELASDIVYIKDRLDILKNQAKQQAHDQKFLEIVYKKQIGRSIFRYGEAIGEDLLETNCYPEEVSIEFILELLDGDTIIEDCLFCSDNDNSNNGESDPQPNVPSQIVIPEELLQEIEDYLGTINDRPEKTLPPYIDRDCPKVPPRTECPLPVWATTIVKSEQTGEQECVCKTNAVKIYYESVPNSNNYVDSGNSVNIVSTTIGNIPHCDCPENLILSRLQGGDTLDVRDDTIICKCPPNMVYNATSGRCECGDIDGKSALQRCQDIGYDTLSGVDPSEYPESMKVSGCDCSCFDHKVYNSGLESCRCLTAIIKTPQGGIINPPVQITADAEGICNCPENTFFDSTDPVTGQMICVQQS